MRSKCKIYINNPFYRKGFLAQHRQFRKRVSMMKLLSSYEGGKILFCKPCDVADVGAQVESHQKHYHYKSPYPNAESEGQELPTLCSEIMNK